MGWRPSTESELREQGYTDTVINKLRAGGKLVVSPEKKSPSPKSIIQHYARVASGSIGAFREKLASARNAVKKLQSTIARPGPAAVPHRTVYRRSSGTTAPPAPPSQKQAKAVSNVPSGVQHGAGVYVNPKTGAGISWVPPRVPGAGDWTSPDAKPPEGFEYVGPLGSSFEVEKHVSAPLAESVVSASGKLKSFVLRSKSAVQGFREQFQRQVSELNKKREFSKSPTAFKEKHGLKEFERVKKEVKAGKESKRRSAMLSFVGSPSPALPSRGGASFGVQSEFLAKAKARTSQELYPSRPGVPELGSLEREQERFVKRFGNSKKKPLVFNKAGFRDLNPVVGVKAVVEKRKREQRMKSIVGELEAMKKPGFGVKGPLYEAALEKPLQPLVVVKKRLPKSKRVSSLKRELRGLQVEGIEPLEVFSSTLAGGGIGALAGGPPGAVAGAAAGFTGSIAGQTAEDVVFTETGSREGALAAGLGVGLLAGYGVARGVSGLFSRAPRTVRIPRASYELELTGEKTGTISSLYKVPVEQEYGFLGLKRKATLSRLRAELELVGSKPAVRKPAEVLWVSKKSVGLRSTNWPYSVFELPKSSARALGLDLKTFEWKVPVLRVKGTATWAGKKFLGREFGARTVSFEHELYPEPRLVRGHEPFSLEYARSGKSPGVGLKQEFGLRYRGFSREGYVGGRLGSFRSRLEFPSRRGIVGFARLEDYRGRVVRAGKGGVKQFVGSQEVLVAKKPFKPFRVVKGKSVMKGGGVTRSGSGMLQKTVSKQGMKIFTGVASSPVVLPTRALGSIVSRTVPVASVFSRLLRPLGVGEKTRVRGSFIARARTSLVSVAGVKQPARVKQGSLVRTVTKTRVKPFAGSGRVPSVVSGHGVKPLVVVRGKQGVGQPSKQVLEQSQPVSPRSTQFLKQAVLPKSPAPEKTKTVFSLPGIVPLVPPPPLPVFGLGVKPARQARTARTGRVKRGYRVLTGSPGRLRQVRGLYSRQAAVSKGAAIVDRGPATAFAVRRVRARGRKSTRVFYPPASLEKKFYRRKKLFVERKKYRFDSPGELMFFSRKTKLEVF